MRANNPKTAPDFHKVVTDYRSGNRSAALLLTGKEGAPNNYRLTLDGDGSTGDWVTPRHRHTKEQFRYVVSGEFHITDKEVLPKGWAAYFPESVYYGPQIKPKDLHMLTLQYGGPSGLGYMSPSQMQKGIETLLARGGKFERGVYTWTDADGRRHNQDAAEAAEEAAWGRKMAYPPPRYMTFIIMNPDAFGWIKDKDTAGIARKNLGTFTERDARFGFVRMNKGATLTFGIETSPEIVFVNEGAIVHGDQRYERHSALATEAEEAPVSLRAVEPTELVYMKLPTF
ncbi:MAG: cupin domain-containing protein [Dongiaceae bacterium]